METGNKMIYERMAAVMKEVKAIGKKEKNLQQNFMFRGIDSVMNELHDLFAKNGIFILQEVMGFTTENRPTKSGGTNTFTRATVKFRYTATDGSCVETVNVGEAMDSADKGMNKAMSAALKYSLTQMFLIPTKETEDPDRYEPEESDYLAMAIQEITAAQSIETLSSIYNAYAPLHAEPSFMTALSNRKKQLKDGTGKV